MLHLSKALILLYLPKYKGNKVISKILFLLERDVNQKSIELLVIAFLTLIFIDCKTCKQQKREKEKRHINCIFKKMLYVCLCVCV